MTAAIVNLSVGPIDLYPCTVTPAAAIAVSFCIDDFGFPDFDDDCGGVSRGGCPVCFLHDTRLLAGEREVAVQDLRPGDLVSVRAPDGGLELQPVKWVGRRAVRAADLAAADRHPVRIRADAFAPGVPQRDLLITGEHCIYVDGRLIPARMLVNGRSIIVDRTISRYAIYHVELARHGILVSEGLTTESYLDTGNRSNFANSPAPALRPDFDLHSGALSWADAAAPLATDRATVEPIWQALSARAQAQGWSRIAPPPALTEEADLHLVTDRGQRVAAIAVRDNRHVFIVPRGTTGLRLASRAARPSDTIGPFVDDRRLLGVKVGTVRVGLGMEARVVSAHPAAAAWDGWHAAEADGSWTNGDAALPIDLAAAKVRSLTVSIEVLGGVPYVLADAPAAASRAA